MAGKKGRASRVKVRAAKKSRRGTGGTGARARRGGRKTKGTSGTGARGKLVRQMRLQDYRETFYEFTGKASDITRQLSFAGIAIIWIFKKETGTALTVPHELLWPGVLIVLALFFDLLQ